MLQWHSTQFKKCTIVRSIIVMLDRPIMRHAWWLQKVYRLERALVSFPTDTLQLNLRFLPCNQYSYSMKLFFRPGTPCSIQQWPKIIPSMICPSTVSLHFLAFLQTSMEVWYPRRRHGSLQLHWKTKQEYSECISNTKLRAKNYFPSRFYCDMFARIS